MYVEQRRYIRFSVHDKIFAALDGAFETVGKVNDISIKGLTLSYLCGSHQDALIRAFSVVDIFHLDNNFYISKVPCKVVYDAEDLKSMGENAIVIRRCGLKFGQLSKSQSEPLELVIENYTTAPLHYIL